MLKVGEVIAYFTVLTKHAEIELVTHLEFCASQMSFLHVLRRPICLRASCRTYASSSAPEKAAVKPAAAKKLSPASSSSKQIAVG